MSPQPIKNKGTSPSKVALRPHLSVEYPVGIQEIAAPIGISPPTHEFSSSLTGNPIIPSLSNGEAGEVHASTLPTENAAKHAKEENFKTNLGYYFVYLPLHAPAYWGSNLAGPSKLPFSLVSTVTENV